jgi:hypothetical protein
VTVTGEPGSTASPEPNSSPSQAPTTQPQWPTAAVTVPFGGQVPPVPTLVAIWVGAHPEGGYDRAAFEFEGLPGYQVGYRSEIAYDGSGGPVDLEGDAFIQVVFNPAQAHDAGQSTLSSPPVQPVEVDFATLESYVLNGDLEATCRSHSAWTKGRLQRRTSPDCKWSRRGLRRRRATIEPS